MLIFKERFLKMERITKPTIITVILLISVLCFIGCKNSYGTKEIATPSRAIKQVKNYMGGTDFSLEQRIAGTLGFNNFHNPKYSSSSATKNSDGSWDVKIKGSMSGYVSDYNNKFKTYNFEIRATVWEPSNISISIQKIN
jgi:hypothetical protein